MKLKKGTLFLIVIAIIAVVGWKNKDFLMKKTEDMKVEMTASKTMTDLRESHIEHFGEHTDRNEFDNLLWTIRPSASVIHLDPMLPVEEKSSNYPKEVFFRYTGIEDIDRVKFVSVSGPSWEEEFLVYENDDVYSKEKVFSVLVLANSEEDAEIILKQMKKNLKPWEWKPGDYVTSDEDASYLSIDIPHEEHIITEEDLNFHRNGEYILFIINDDTAVEEGTQQNMEYLTKLFDKALEESREYYASQDN